MILLELFKAKEVKKKQKQMFKDFCFTKAYLERNVIKNYS